MAEEIDTEAVEAAQLAVAELFASNRSADDIDASESSSSLLTTKAKVPASIALQCEDDIVDSFRRRSLRCIALGCRNKAYDILKWKEVWCNAHSSKRGRCPCRIEQPFQLLHLNRKSNKMSMLFAELALPFATFRLIELKNKMPSQHWRICSDHFYESHIGNKNAFPILGLGKTHEEIRAITRKYGCEDELPLEFDGMNLCVQRLKPCFSITRTLKKYRDKRQRRRVRGWLKKTSSEHGSECDTKNLDGLSDAFGSGDVMHNRETDGRKCKPVRSWLNASKSFRDIRLFRSANSALSFVEDTCNGDPCSTASISSQLEEASDTDSSANSESNRHCDSDMVTNLDKKRRSLTVSILQRRPLFKCLVRCCPITNHMIKPETGMSYFFYDLPSVLAVRDRWLLKFVLCDKEFHFPPPLIGCGKYAVCERHFERSRRPKKLKSLASNSLCIMPMKNLTPEEAADVELDTTAPLDYIQSTAKALVRSVSNIGCDALRREMKTFTTNWCCREVPELRKIIIRLSSKIDHLYDLIVKLCQLQGVSPTTTAEFNPEEDDRCYGKAGAGSLLANEADRIAFAAALEGLQKARDLHFGSGIQHMDSENDICVSNELEKSQKDLGESNPDIGVSNSNDVSYEKSASLRQISDPEKKQKQDECHKYHQNGEHFVYTERNSEEQTPLEVLETEENAPQLSPHVEEGPPLLFSQVDGFVER